MLVCSVLIYIAINTDVERIKLDTAAEFSSRVQHLETTIGQLETMATILSQSMAYTVTYYGHNPNGDILDYFEPQGELLSLKFIDEHYQSGLYTENPVNANQRKRLELLLKTGPYLPHFLHEEKIEKVAIYNHAPKAKLVYPNSNKESRIAFSKELKASYWQYFWEKHQNRNIYWKLIKVEDSYKLSLTVSVLDSVDGLVGLIQFIFSQDVFDQEIDPPSGPDSLVFLSEISSPPILIATTEYEKNEYSIGKTFNMQEGKELPKEIQALLQSLGDWVYQSDDYFVLSVPISGAFNLVYLTDAKGFSFLSSNLLQFSVLILIFLVFLGVFVDRLVFHNLTMLKQKDDSLTEKNRLLTTALSELEEAQQELIHKEKIVSLGNLVAGLAHQLNTPLSIVITAVTYIIESFNKFSSKLESGIRKSELKEFLQNGRESSLLISNNLAKATGLIDNFKLLASNESEDDISQFNVIEYTEAVLSGLRPTLDKRRIKSSINSSQDIHIYNYPVYYTQIIVQLVNNAVLHGLGYDGNIRIEIYKSNDLKGVMVDIIDDGKGIAQEDIDRIFEPFFTSKCVAEQMGLGLTIVHNLVSGKMSGAIKVSSDAGKGSCFSLYLPSLMP